MGRRGLFYISHRQAGMIVDALHGRDRFGRKLRPKAKAQQKIVTSNPNTPPKPLTKEEKENAKLITVMLASVFIFLVLSVFGVRGEIIVGAIVIVVLIILMPNSLLDSKATKLSKEQQLRYEWAVKNNFWGTAAHDERTFLNNQTVTLERQYQDYLRQKEEKIKKLSLNYDAINLPLKEWQIVRLKLQAEAKAKELMRQKKYEAQRLNQPHEPEDLERLIDKFERELVEKIQEEANGLKLQEAKAEEINPPLKEWQIVRLKRQKEAEAIRLKRQEFNAKVLRQELEVAKAEAIKSMKDLDRLSSKFYEGREVWDSYPYRTESEIKKVGQPERHIQSKVKQSVWRRDNGRCVECKSNEKIEYDHIIPVSKGGSNTERNIQLLCEKCNRKKSATIQ